MGRTLLIALFLSSCWSGLRRRFLLRACACIDVEWQVVLGFDLIALDVWSKRWLGCLLVVVCVMVG